MRYSSAWLIRPNCSKWTRTSHRRVPANVLIRRNQSLHGIDPPLLSHRHVPSARGLTPLPPQDAAQDSGGPLTSWEGYKVWRETAIRKRLWTTNCLLLRVCKKGEMERVWRIYAAMRAQSINPDAYTYSILLNYAKRREDRDGIDQILADARHDGTLEKSPFIIADLLHVVYLRERRERNGAVFTTLLSTYQLFFDVQPLKDLGLLSDEYYQPPSPNLSQPPPPPLGMMIVAFLIQSEGHTIQALFRRYRDHVDRAHPIISSLAATDYAANAYLMALGRDFQTLHLCTGVVEYMLRSPHATPRSTPRGDVVEHAVPTVQTWSILLAAFLRHGQRMAARKVLDMMRKRRLEPNLVTWNTLISGLSRLQDVNGALSALRDMKDAGFEMDHRTLEGLGWIRDRRNLLQALKESDQEQDDEDFSDDDPDLDGGHHIESDGEQRPS